MATLEQGVIGNGTIAALIDREADHRLASACRDWTASRSSMPCWAAAGGFSISLKGMVSAQQAYVRNTAILETVLTAQDGSSIRITDFAPRFTDRGPHVPARRHRPAGHPLAGMPRITVGTVAAERSRAKRDRAAPRGLPYQFPNEDAGFRVTTDAPVSYILDQRSFVLDRTHQFHTRARRIPVRQSGRDRADWLRRTRETWKEWARRLATPPEWQDAVIRAAITLKLCVYEETGGIVAALTTSIPEHAGSQRNWDYRYCWLRDAYFTVTALNRLSAVGTLERYLAYLRNTVAMTKGGHIQPVYGIALEE